MIRLIHRPARITRPLPPAAAEQLAPPPQLPEGRAGGVPLQALLPVLGAGSSVVMMVVLRGSNPAYMVVAGLVFVVALVGGLGLSFTQRAQNTRQRRNQRERYLDYLEEQRSRLRARGDEARNRATELDPAPGTLPQLAADPERLWERRPGDADFLRARLGSGDVRRLALAAPADPNPVQPLDPLMLAEARQLVDTHAVVHGMPLTVALDGAGEVAIIGPRADATATARALIAQLATLHAPDDLLLAAAFPPAAADDWARFDLLPHAALPPVAGEFPRRTAPDAAALARLIGDELADRVQAVARRRRSGVQSDFGGSPRLVVVLDEHGHEARPLPLPESGFTLAELGITIVRVLADRLDEPSELAARVVVGGGRVTIDDLRADGDGALPERLDGHADAVPPALFQSVARALAPLRLSAPATGVEASDDAVSVTGLLGLDDLENLDPVRAWAGRAPRDFLRVPIGVDEVGAPLLLDLKESAQLGMGPHGLCVGATGSGKSELLRTLVLGLAATHSPDDLAMILVDYKGGAAFAPFAPLGHVAGLIDNLEDDPMLTRRARESIAGEVRRRQQQLRAAGSSPNITHYRELRRTRPDLPPMPHLLVVIDEFGELLESEPDFVDLLLTIGRIGRSIGVHLLLSSQRIEAGKLKGLDTYLSYRIGLRTFSEAESSVVLNTPDAFTLPAVPGYGYLKVDTSVYTRFRAGYVSGPADAPAPRATGAGWTGPALLSAYGSSAEASAPDAAAEPAEPYLPDTGRSVAEEAVARLAAARVETAPVWLPPLPALVALDDVVDTSGPDAALRGLRTPIGLIDDPARQRQDPWLFDLTVRGGHAAIIGAPQSGRTTFLRTLAASLALTHTPREVGIYGMDLAGGGLARLEGFPHVGGVATRADRGRLARLLEELQGMIRQREAVFREHGIDSVAELRRRHAAGGVPELVSADIVLLVDGFGAMRSEFEELEDAFGEILVRGSGFGIHAVVALNRWNELRAAAQPLIGQRFELRLNDPADSVIGRAAATALRSSTPGRVLTEDALYAQLALPAPEAGDAESLGDALSELASRANAGWTGPAAAPIRVLPDHLDPDTLPDAFDEPELVPFGLRQDTMGPVFFDPQQDLHLLVFGDTGSGKTTLLRGLAQEFMARYSPDELVLAVMDVRGGVAAAVTEDYLGGHAANGRDARALAEAIAGELAQRAGGRASAAPRPRIVLLIDDYDILASGGTEPLRPLLEFLPSSRDLLLDVVLTRPVAGAGRALYDVALQAIRDTGGTGLVLSGDRAEGQILPKVYAETMPPGRGRLVRRGRPATTVQIAEFREQSLAAAERSGADAS